MAAATVEFQSAAIPDETPELEGEDFDSDYPGSTPEAPFGYKADGTPYRRRHGGRRGSGKSVLGGRRTPSSDVAAKSAASLLARLNSLIGIGLMTAGLTKTAVAIHAGNETFETMAYEALLGDPQLCKKILSTGATSGKAGLVMAYSMLAVSVAPSVKEEIQERRAATVEDE